MNEARSATREVALAGLLDAVNHSGLEEWMDSHAVADADFDGGLRVLATALMREWCAAIALHDELPPPPATDRTARWLRAGAGCWALSGDPTTGSLPGLAPLDDPDLGSATCALERFAVYLMVEGALAHARLDLALALVERVGPKLWDRLVLDGDTHEFSIMLGICRTRLLVFSGQVQEAGEVLADVRAHEPPVGSTVAALVAATGTLVRGNGADPTGARRLAAEVSELVPHPVDHLTAGAHLLVAFGLIAIGDVDVAVQHLLAAGSDAELGAFNVIDRALGLELLVSLAVAEADLDAAQAWRDPALALMSSPIADSSVARLLARVELLAGHAAAAQVLAERAVTRAAEAGRWIEEAEGRIVLNQARLAGAEPGARAEAVHALATMVEEAESRGHRSARRAASRTLRPAGLRLPPLARSSWAGLTEREAEVARWVAEGATNREVAERLVVSEHTVRAHVSRVLAAFGVATRSGLPGAMGLSATSGPERTRLTPRQQQVATLVARGCGNREIAAELDLSVRTVERHVGDILLRWDLPGRTSIARSVFGAFTAGDVQ